MGSLGSLRGLGLWQAACRLHAAAAAAGHAPAGWPAAAPCSSTSSSNTLCQQPSPQQHHQAARWSSSSAASAAGQPTPTTHPHLLGPGELTPGISAEEYAARRQRLCATLPPGALVVLPASAPMFMSGIIPYPYRQDADFLYLTGISQPAVAVLQVQGGLGQHCYTLFLAPEDAEKARWDGAPMGARAALEFYGADVAACTSELRQRLAKLIPEAPLVMLDLDKPTAVHSMEVRAAVADAARHVAGASSASSATAAAGSAQGGADSARQPRLVPLRPAVQAMRAKKSSAEVALMRASAGLAAAALERCIRISRPGIAEQTLAATFEFECKRRNASRMAFPPVVAGGTDACTIHYGRNDKLVAPGELVLMDAGCELAGYASDVTRTWPVTGRFTAQQLDVYQAVLDVHARCLAACKPGSSIRELHQLSVRAISGALRELLLPRVPVDDIVARHCNTFYWHSVSHHIGMDTHDVASISAFDRTLEAGHCITIEPGLYVPDDPMYGAYRGIGVRIEDVVLVTQDGCEVLSDAVPRGPQEIEGLVGSLVP